MCRASTLSVFYLGRCLEGISFTSAYGPVAEISASVQNPRFLRSQVIKNYEFKIVHNCLDMVVTGLMYHCKCINKLFCFCKSPGSSLKRKKSLVKSNLD